MADITSDTEDTNTSDDNAPTPKFTSQQAKAILEAALSEGASDGSVFTIHSLKVSKSTAAPPSAEMVLSRTYPGVQEARKHIAVNKWYTTMRKPRSFCRLLQSYYPFIAMTLQYTKQEEWEERYMPMMEAITEHEILASQHSAVVRGMLREYMSEHIEPAATMQAALQTGEKTWWHKPRDPDDPPETWPHVCVPHSYLLEWAESNTAYKDVLRRIEHSDLHDGIESWLTSVGIDPPCCDFVSLKKPVGETETKVKVWLLPHISLLQHAGGDLL